MTLTGKILDDAIENMQKYRTIDLHMMGMSIAILAQIAEAIERDGGVIVINAATPVNGPGVLAFELGRAVGALEKK